MSLSPKERALVRRVHLACTEALRLWGPELQLRMLQEEAGELVAIINHVARGREPLHAIAPEVADVIILCIQASIVLGADRVLEQIESKTARLERRIADERGAGEG
jgi:NTP pyrophosphatase (non-canonical NTP hydrolase)